MTRATLCVGLCAVLSGPVLAASKAIAPPKPLAAMKRRVTRPVVSGKLPQAFEQFGKLFGVRVEVDWPSVVATGVKKTDTVTVKPRRATGEQLMDMMLARIAKRGKPLSWLIDGKVVRVTTQARVLLRKRLPLLIARVGRVRRVRRGTRGLRSLTFDGTALKDVIGYFRDISGLNLHVNWPSLQLIGVDPQTPVTLKASNLSLGRALSLVTDLISAGQGKLERVYWIVDDGVVTIATGSAFNSRLRTRVFDVSDLLLVVPNFQAPEVEMNDLGNSSDRQDRSSSGGLFSDSDSRSDSNQDEENIAEQRQLVRTKLIDIIKDSIGQDMWQPIGKGSIRLLGKQLVISQTQLGFKLLEEAARPR